MTTIRQLSELSTVLKSMRKQRGLSQAQVGTALGLSQERVSAMENYPERLTVDNLFTLLMVLGAELSVSTGLSEASQILRFTSDEKATKFFAESLNKNTPIFNKAQLSEISKPTTPTTRQTMIRDASGKKKAPTKSTAAKSKTAPKSIKGW